MPIYKPSAGGRTDVPEVKPARIYEPEYKNSLVESTYTNQTSFLSNVTGTPIKTDFYHQHRGASEEPIGLQLDDINTYQSYDVIRGLIIKFEGKPGYSFDPTTAISSEAGTGFIIADVSPTIGDMFIRDIGDGRAGLYQLTAQPELRSYARDKVYFVTFTLLSIMNQSIEDNLNSKIVKEYFYSKDSALMGGNALVTSENYELTKNLLKTVPALVTRLYNLAYFNPEETIVIKGLTKEITYDEAYVRFLSQIIPVKAIGRLKPITLINTQVGSDYTYSFSENVYNAILTGNVELLKSLENKTYTYQRTQFFTTRYYGNAGFSKINFFILNQPLNYSGVGLNTSMDTYQVIPNTSPQSTQASYFSDGFYQGNPANDFERLVYNFAFNNIRDRAALLDYIEKSFSLDEENFVYQAGLLVMMVMQSRRVLIGD